LAAPMAANAQVQLKPYKDALFAYPATLKSERSGAFLSVAYNRDRDIMKRDTIPRRKAQQKYVNERVRWSRKLRRYQSANGTFKYYAVGEQSGARVTVIYVHGRGGNHRQGVNDWTFGGNFNRLQNLMTRNGGVLLTPAFSDFKDRGARDVEALLTAYKTKSPGTKMIIACGSMGGGVCWRLLASNRVSSAIDGMFFLGSFWNPKFLNSSMIRQTRRAVPLYFGHGGADVVFAPAKQKRFFEQILAKNPRYPARFVMFDTGTHGTPIRMVDWRRELNWMLRH
ncbi:MAG: dienelactone hydrolase family protein, partial [Pseudomonadota bacterium]